MADSKITKKMRFETLIDVVEASDVEEKEDLVEFLAHEIDMLEAKAAKAAERAAAKKAESDELCETVFSLLTTEDQTADEITAAIGDESVTKSKVVNRLGKLVTAGRASKHQVTTNGRRIMKYTVASVDADEE